MKIHRTYCYRIYPNGEQLTRLTNWENALRCLWNVANEQRLLGLSRKRYYSGYEQINQLTECGYVAKENRPSQSEFRCLSCGHIDNADVNAAKILLLRGMAVENTVTACGGCFTP